MHLSTASAAGNEFIAVPTFTKIRLTGSVSSYTPAASRPVHCSIPGRLLLPIGLQTAEAGSPSACGLPSTAPTHIHQVGVGRRL